MPNITTCSETMASDLQDVAVRMGKWATVGKDSRSRPGQHQCYRVHLHSTHKTRFQTRRVQYSGMVHCVSVPNGTIYVRRNGKPVWTGNSWVVVGNAESPTQLRQWQDALDISIGDTAARHQAYALPAGSTTIETHQNALNDSYDMINKEEILAAFSLTAMEMGLLPGGRSSGLGGKGVAEHSQDLNVRAATQPLLQFLKVNIFDYVLQTVSNQHDMEWHWGIEAEADPKEQTDQLTSLIDHGLMTRDEGRVEMGLQPFGLALTSAPTVPVSQGVVSLSDGQTITDDPAEFDPDNGPPPQEGGPAEVGPTNVPTNNPTKPTPPANQSPATTPLHEAQVTPQQVQHGDDETDEPIKMISVDQIKAELSKLKGYLRHGKDLAQFKTEALPSRLQGRVAYKLNNGAKYNEAIEDALVVVDQNVSGMNKAASAIATSFDLYKQGTVTRQEFVTSTRHALGEAYEATMGFEDMGLFENVAVRLPYEITRQSCVDMIQDYAIGLGVDLVDSHATK